MKKKILYILILTCFFVVLSKSPVSATGAQSFDVSPAKESIHLDPGANYEHAIQVHNNGEKPIHIDTSILPYQVSNHSYDPIYKATQYTEITNWIKLGIESFDLNPGDTLMVPYSIVVPEDIHAGGQYAIIAFDSVNASTKDTTVEAIQRIGVIISAEVSGETRIGGEILEQKIEGFKFQPPISAQISVSNTGNISNNVSTVMKIYNFFDGSEVYSNASNPTMNSVLPDTIRDTTISWDSSPSLGIFKVSLTTSYLNDVSTITKTVILCPLWFIIIILIIIVSVIVFIAAKLRKRRKIHRRSSEFNV